MGLEWSFQPSVELRRRPVKDFSDSLVGVFSEVRAVLLVFAPPDE